MDFNAAAFRESYIPGPSSPLAPAPEPASAPEKDPFRKLHVLNFLEILLHDRTTGKNIIWATDTYASLGKGFGKKDPILPEIIIGRYDGLMGVRRENRLQRARKHGEVFTPLSVCKIMCDHAYKTLRGRDWKKYIQATVLEIACGEAPFLASRKDLGNGEKVPIKSRVGILDRKLQLIGEKTASKEEWLAWAFKAFEATYGYEFQGDNLLLARLSLLATFEEYFKDRWQSRPGEEEYKRILNIISWNIWQMDGLTGAPPYGELPKSGQGYLLATKKDENEAPPCLIRDWEDGEVMTFLSMGG